MVGHLSALSTDATANRVPKVFQQNTLGLEDIHAGPSGGRSFSPFSLQPPPPPHHRPSPPPIPLEPLQLRQLGIKADYFIGSFFSIHFHF